MEGRQSFLRDFFFELFKDSDNQRPHFLLEREAWFRNLELNRKEERLFELEMYLRAVGCFFNLHNQFLQDRDQAITRDFSAELKVLAAALERGTALSQLLLDRGLASSFDFQSYIENQVAPDYLRLQMLRRTLDQKRPEESLYLLNRCFRDLKKIIDHLLKRPPCTYSLFYHLGQVVTREIAFNRFFNPLLILEFKPEYDRIRSVVILDAMRKIEDRSECRAASKVFLALFRLLHYLRYIPRSGRARILRRSLILFTLFHSEANTLAGFLRVLAGRSPQAEGGLGQAAGMVAASLRAQLVDLFGGELVQLDVERAALLGQEERSVASGSALLEAFIKECIGVFVQVYQPEASVAELFDSDRNQLEQSARLRSDLWLFKEILERLLRTAQASPAGRLYIPTHLARFSDYFLETSYNFLRYGDGGPFERYHAVLTEGLRHSGSNGTWSVRFLEDTARFRDYLIETYDLVCRRAELCDRPLETDMLTERLGRWTRRDGE